MGVDIKKVYMKVAENKQATMRRVFFKVSHNGNVLGINGSLEKVDKAIKNLYAKERDVIDISKLEETDLSKYHLILIGSHAKKFTFGDKLKKFIEEGGYLVTTDRSLDTIVSNMFPDLIGYEKKEIKGGAVKGEISNLNHPFLRGAAKKNVLKFWIEENTHPIKKVRPEIENLVSSKKLEKKYGSGLMMVAFRYKEGMVVHMMPKLHPEKQNEEGHLAAAHILSNILDEAVSRAVVDEIQRPTESGQMAYINMTVIKDPKQKCVFCGSTFENYKDKVYLCSSCKSHYHEFCLEQQLARDGTCTGCSRILIFEKFKGQMEAAMMPRSFLPPQPPAEQEQKKEEVPPPPPEKKSS
jgi:hypothetical protein